MHSTGDKRTDGGRPRHHWTSPRWAAKALRHLWSSEVNEAAVELLAPRPGEHVVDLGSGLGPATVRLARRLGPTGRVTAVDPSGAMRAVLRARRLWQPDRRAIEVRAGSGEALPFADGTVDAVVSLNAIHHFADLDRTAAELARVLRPGGRLLLADEDFARGDHSFHPHGGEDHGGPELVDRDHLVGVLERAGLTDVGADARDLGGEPAHVFTARR